MPCTHTRIFTNFDGWFFKRHHEHPHSLSFNQRTVNLNETKDSNWVINTLLEDGVILEYEPKRPCTQGTYYSATYLFKNPAYLFLNTKRDGTLNPMQATALMLNLRHNTTLIK